MSATPTEFLTFLTYVSPGFHIGLCPHFTLGCAGVSCLRHSRYCCLVILNFDVLTPFQLVRRTRFS